MGRFRKLMTLCFGWQYVLLIHYDGHKQVSRAICRDHGFSWDALPFGPRHKPHTSCWLLPCGEVGRSWYIKEWRPITSSMWKVYDGDKITNRGGA